MIIRSDFCSILNLNSKTTFLYVSDLSIIDAFCIGLNQLVVVEKDTKIIKVFPNYEIGSLKFNEILVSDLNGSNFIKSATSSNSKYENESIKEIDLVCEFINGDIKQILIRYLKQNRFDSVNSDHGINYFLSDNKTLKFDSDSESESDDECEEDELEKNFKFIKVNKNLDYSIIKLFRSTGQELHKILKIQNSQFNYLLKTDEQYNLARSYLSFKNGDFVIINLSLSPKKPVLCYYFKNPCKEPIVKIEHSLLHEHDGFYFIFYTKSYTYLAHSNIKDDDNDEQKGMCLFELNGQYDQVIYLNRNYFLVSKDGIIECFKLNCISKKHRTKLIFSINTLSKQVTKLIVNGKKL